MLNMASKFISFVVPEEMLDEIDEHRGDVPRSIFLRKLILKSLETENKKGVRTK